MISFAPTTRNQKFSTLCRVISLAIAILTPLVAAAFEGKVVSPRGIDLPKTGLTISFLDSAARFLFVSSVDSGGRFAVDSDSLAPAAKAAWATGGLGFNLRSTFRGIACGPEKGRFFFDISGKAVDPIEISLPEGDSKVTDGLSWLAGISRWQTSVFGSGSDLGLIPGIFKTSYRTREKMLTPFSSAGTPEETARPIAWLVKKGGRGPDEMVWNGQTWPALVKLLNDRAVSALFNGDSSGELAQALSWALLVSVLEKEGEKSEVPAFDLPKSNPGKEAEAIAMGAGILDVLAKAKVSKPIQYFLVCVSENRLATPAELFLHLKERFRAISGLINENGEPVWRKLGSPLVPGSVGKLLSLMGQAAPENSDARPGSTEEDDSSVKQARSSELVPPAGGETAAGESGTSDASLNADRPSAVQAGAAVETTAQQVDGFPAAQGSRPPAPPAERSEAASGKPAPESSGLNHGWSEVSTEETAAGEGGPLEQTLNQNPLSAGDDAFSQSKAGGQSDAAIEPKGVPEPVAAPGPMGERQAPRDDTSLKTDEVPGSSELLDRVDALKARIASLKAFVDKGSADSQGSKGGPEKPAVSKADTPGMETAVEKEPAKTVPARGKGRQKTKSADSAAAKASKAGETPRHKAPTKPARPEKPTRPPEKNRIESGASEALTTPVEKAPADETFSGAQKSEIPQGHGVTTASAEHEKGVGDRVEAQRLLAAAREKIAGFGKNLEDISGGFDRLFKDLGSGKTGPDGFLERHDAMWQTLNRVLAVDSSGKMWGEASMIFTQYMSYLPEGSSQRESLSRDMGALIDRYEKLKLSIDSRTRDACLEAIERDSEYTRITESLGARVRDLRNSLSLFSKKFDEAMAPLHAEFDTRTPKHFLTLFENWASDLESGILARSGLDILEGRRAGDAMVRVPAIEEGLKSLVELRRNWIEGPEIAKEMLRKEWGNTAGPAGRISAAYARHFGTTPPGASDRPSIVFTYDGRRETFDSRILDEGREYSDLVACLSESSPDAALNRLGRIRVRLEAIVSALSAVKRTDRFREARKTPEPGTETPFCVMKTLSVNDCRIVDFTSPLHVEYRQLPGGRVILTGEISHNIPDLGAVAVSLDGGATWDAADGREFWYYSFFAAPGKTYGVVARPTFGDGKSVPGANREFSLKVR